MAIPTIVTKVTGDKLTAAEFNIVNGRTYNTVTPQMYGAVGDGETDDSQAFLDAITALPATGGTLFVPQGDYVISITISKANVTIIGCGEQTILRKPATALAASFMITSEFDNTIIQNVKMFGAVKLNLSDNSRVYDCVIDATDSDYGIWMRGNWQQINRCIIGNANEANVHVDQLSNSGLKINSSVFKNSLGNGVELAWVGAIGAGDTAIGQIFVGNTFGDNTKYGLHITGTHDNVITGNFFEANGYGGVFITQIIETVITGNYFEYNRNNDYETAPGANLCGGIVLQLADSSGVGNENGTCIISGNEMNGERACVQIAGTDNTNHLIKVSSNLFLNSWYGVKASNYQENYVIQVSDNAMLGRVGLLGTFFSVASDSAKSGKRLHVTGNFIFREGQGVYSAYVNDVLFDNNRFIEVVNRAAFITQCNAEFRYNSFESNDADVVLGTNGAYVAIGNKGLADTTNAALYNGTPTIDGNTLTIVNGVITGIV